MSQPRSDNRQENHNKPVQNGERKLEGGVYVDYTDTEDVFANNVAAFLPNKYVWIAGVRYHIDSDGVTFRVAGGGAGVKYLKFAINADGSGSPDSKFDGYKAEGPTLSDARLENVRLTTVIAGGIGYQDFFPDALNYITYSSVPGIGTIDFTGVGGLSAPGYVIIIFEPQ